MNLDNDTMTFYILIGIFIYVSATVFFFEDAPLIANQINNGLIIGLLVGIFLKIGKK
ncbi:hypothetical protein [Planococcus lenghuensis]|uniref:hypothetical protein n=1 Tax=Planococcus lenghuensis TaxID=2213202 RepID=UPI0012EC9ACC|nr:hypothetical protein [Planococcus lenghuensis]